MTLLDLIWTSQQFALIWMTTGGGPINVTEMLSTYTYKLAFSHLRLLASPRPAPCLILLMSMVLAILLRSPPEGEGLTMPTMHPPRNRGASLAHRSGVSSPA